MPGRMVGVKIAVVALVLAAAVTTGAHGAVNKADLVVPRANMQSLQAAAGTSVAVTVRVKNAARRRTAGRSVVRLFLSSDKRRGAGDRALAPGSARLARIKPGKRSSRRLSAVVPAATATGPYYVLACADARKQVRERSERNNCRAVATLSVPAAEPSGGGGTPSGGGGATPGGGGSTPGGGGAGTKPAPPNEPDLDGHGVPDAKDSDIDGDGTANAADCRPKDPAYHPGAADAPDPSGEDRDCDGIDGHPVTGKDVFVWSGAPNDAAIGTQAAPKKTMQAAVALADQRGGDVYAATGTYEGTLQLRSGVSIYGGYDAETWERSNLFTEPPGGLATVIVGAGEGIYADGAYNVELQLLRVIGVADPLKGRSAYGIRATDYSDVVLDNVDVVAGHALAGPNGNAGTAGAPGAKGGDGLPGLCDDGYETTMTVGNPRYLQSWAQGGENGAPPGAIANANGTAGVVTFFDTNHGPNGQGGWGGVEGSNWAWDGEPATGQTVGAPGGDTAAENGANGAPGPNGTTPGAPGLGAGNNLAGAGATWAGISAWSGGTGTAGGYGGGGGGGAGNDDGIDGSGGGGGAGGQGGKGGTGGKPGIYGGGSFGVYAYNNSNVTLKGATRITTGDGGKGGNGGAGGTGGNGGPGGQGGKTDCSPTEVGHGGNGGNGGKGAPGGPGGGGAGGPSIGVMLLGDSTVAGFDEADVTLGNAGAGGSTPPGGQPGQAGVRLASNLD